MEPTREQVIEKAKDTYEEEGAIEIDDNAKISPSDGGWYVQAWVYVSTEDMEGGQMTCRPCLNRENKKGGN